MRPSFSVLGVLVILTTHGARTVAADVEPEIRRIAARVNAVEAQLERAVYYEKKDTAFEETATDQAWLTESRDILKVSRERIGKTDRARKEIWFLRSTEPIFVLARHETTLPDGKTRVAESRRYFRAKDGRLIRELKKQADFAAGEALDTKDIKNVATVMAEFPERERSSESSREDAQELTSALVEAGPPKRDPAEATPGDSARYRLIHDSTSPDGRFAVGLGFPEAPKSWDEFYLVSDSQTQTDDYWVEEFDAREKARNYIVDLKTRRIIAEMPAEVYATKTSVGRDGWEHKWSPDGGWLVQTTHDRWSSNLRVFRVDSEPACLGPLDVAGQVEKQAAAFLKAMKDRSLKGVEDSFGFYLYEFEIGNDGLLMLNFTLCVPGSKTRDDLPSLIERFRLKNADGKLSAEFVGARYE